MSLTLANKLTITRILSVPFFIATIMYYSPERDYLRLVAFGIFLFAVLTDALDGYIARAWGQKTRAGAIMDPLADKALLIASFVCLFEIRTTLPVMGFPAWLIIAVISRDVILLIGAGLIFSIHGEVPVNPSLWGKATTFFQGVSVAGMLLQWGFTSVFWYLAFGFTVVSGIDYIRQGVKLLNSPADHGKM